MASVLKTVSLFSGAGGLDLGLERSGKFQSVLCVDHFEDALATLRTNVGHPLDCGEGALSEARIICGDLSTDPVRVVREALGDSDAEVDFVVGGPPCQSFSVIGKRKGMTDPRGNLVLSYLAVIEGLRPLGFIFENVPGFATIHDGRVYGSLLAEFRRLGYGLWTGVLRAADYGAPTLRERLFIVGIKGGPRCLPSPMPTHAAPDDLSGILPGIDDRLPWVTSADALEAISPSAPNHTLVAHTDAVVDRFSRLGPGVRDEARRRNRLDPDKPSFTLFAGGVVGKKQARTHIHPFEPRELSPRECARLHGFPDTWLFAGEHDSILLQIANSVPVPLAQAVGNYAAEMAGLSVH